MRGVLFSLLLMVFLASGCAVRNPVGSWCGPLPESGAVSSIAADAVSCLSTLYPPGHTTLYLVPAKKDGFAVALENGLRTRGFTMSTSPDDPDAITVAYTLDSLEDKVAWYLQLRLSDGKAISRSYSASGQPEGGQSRTSVEPRSHLTDKIKRKTGQLYDNARGEVRGLVE